MSSLRIRHLIKQMHAADIDCVALVPGPNLVYLTGLHFHLSERPVIAFFPATGQPVLLAPGFEAVKTQHAPQPIDWQLFTYSDNIIHGTQKTTTSPLIGC